MRTTRIPAGILIAAVLIIGTAAWAQHDHSAHGNQNPPQAEHAEAGKSMTLKGELVDMACYMAHEGKGAKHKSCAQACIKDGAPMGVLDPSGRLVLLVEDHSGKKPYETLKERAGEQVEVTGAFFERGGVPALVVKSIGGAK